MARRDCITAEEAEIIALKALAFLASDGERLGRFMALTGLGPQEIRTGAAEPAFLAAVLEHLRGDETLLLVFAESENLDPGAIGEAAVRLGGAPA